MSVKHVVAPVPIMFGRFALMMRDPGVVRFVGFEMKPALVMTRGAPDFEEVPVLFIEADTHAPQRKRRFLAVKLGEHFELEDYETAEWLGTGLSGRGTAAMVYEITGEPTS